MKHFRSLTLGLMLLVAAACQSSGPVEPDASPSPAPTEAGAQPDLFPATTDLQESLAAAGADVALEGPVEQPFFSAPGQIITVNGEAVQVFEYSNPALADTEAGDVAPDGSSIGTTMASWVGPPHFFRAEPLIVLYVGDNLAVLELLETVLGPQFAGADTQAPGEQTEPPAASLKIGDQEQPAGIGSFCWPDSAAGVALCVDKIGLPTVPEPVQVKSPFTAQLLLPLSDPPQFLSLAAMPVTLEDQIESDAGGMRWWAPGSSESYDVPVAPPHSIELNLDPGLYVLSVFAQWQNLGDVSYGFLVEVLPADAAESPEVAFVQVLAEVGLNLRTAPDTDSEVVGVARQFEIVQVTGQSPDGGWWRVACSETASGECWMSADPAWSVPTNLAEASLAGLIYVPPDRQPERPLWRVEADGGSVQFLANSTDLGALSPDGMRVVTHLVPRGETNLALVELASGERRQLTDTADRLNFNPQWWPANPDSIVFMSRAFNAGDQPAPGPGNLAMVKTDGTGFQLLDAENLTHTLLPALSPDGQTIAYDRGGLNASRDGILTPWLYHLEDGPAAFDYAAYGLAEVPDLSFGRAAWSPDGRYLAWVIGGELSGDGEWQIGLALFNLEAQSVLVVYPHAPTSGPFVAGWAPPTWNPNGEWLAWAVSPEGERPGFWVMRPDGTDRRFIDQAAEPLWSPDGSSLVYAQLTGGAIMVMETGQWQPRRSGLPAQTQYVAWIDIDE